MTQWKNTGITKVDREDEFAAAVEKTMRAKKFERVVPIKK